MKKLVAILFAALIIGVTPAFAIPLGEITADPMAVKGKGLSATGMKLSTDEYGYKNGYFIGDVGYTANVTMHL